MRTIMAALAATAVLTVLAARAVSSESAPVTSQAAAGLSGVHDFDFIVGEWRAHHRRLKERLAGSREWIEFEGTQSARQVLGGAANVDDNILEMPAGSYRGFTLRAFDPKTNLWAIWWLDGRTPEDPLDPPVRGRFENGVGTFYADDTFKGKPIRVRFTWSHPTPTTNHWEQAFSPDGGKTWETNWITDFTRVS